MSDPRHRSAGWPPRDISARGSRGYARGDDRGVYAISVAAELTGVEPHTLRTWERAGLLTPSRSEGGTRRYSADDLDMAQHIHELATAGINLPGIARVLELEHQLNHALREIDRLANRPPP